MKIGIDGSRAFIKNRTGVEEYSYQVVKHLMNKLNEHEVVLYIRKEQNVNLKLPSSWKIKKINFPYLWTQVGLSIELLFHPVDKFFVPAHTVSIIHPRNTIVTIHGLEYEIFSQGYSFWARMYMRWSIKNSCKWAKKIIAVSQNTKKDLMRLYKVVENKITVIYEGYDDELQNFKTYKPWLLFVGRLEERKNIIGIIRAYEILKEKYKIPHRLILAGKFGYGSEKIKQELDNVNCADDIILPGFVKDEDKFSLIKNADVFLFPTFYEGFGIPILEAQSVGVPVVASNNSSIPEVAGNSAILVDPHNAEEIADATYKLISDKNLRDDIIKRGYENVKRFSWEKCASKIADLLLNK